MMKQDTKAKQVFLHLQQVIPNAQSELHFTSVFELLIAVILSAQCTDKRVNMVTKDLFQRWATPEDFASCDTQELEQAIKPCGFYQVKAKHIQNACKKIVSQYAGQVPATMEELLTLDGVGRKTASVVLAVGYHIPAIAVDTHVQRVSNRIGLCHTTNVVDTENALKQLYPKHQWEQLHHLLLLHGRYCCKARNPQCATCVLQKLCEYNQNKK